MKRPAEDAAEEPAQKKPAVCTDAKSGQAEGPYFVHDNGGRPFKVEVTRTNSSKANVQVFKILNQSESEDGEDGEDGEDQEDAGQKESKEGVEGVEGVRVVTAGDLAKELGVDKLFLKMADGEGEEEEDGEEDEEDQDMPNYEEQASVTLSVERVFVGQCPKHGARFDGNSMLLHLEGLKYVFVGEQVFSFTAKAPITKYVSPVGNSDVPYPWAMDEQGLRYLMISSVILTSKLFENSDTDPYDLFFDRSLITADIGFVPPKQPLSQFQGITEFWIGEEQYTLRYEPHPEADFDRLSGMGELFVVKSDGKIKLSKVDYLKLMQDFAEEMGFQALDTQTLVERQI